MGCPQLESILVSMATANSGCLLAASWVPGVGGEPEIVPSLLRGKGQLGSQGGHPWVPGAASRWKSRPDPARVPVSPPRRVNVGCGPTEERVLLTGLHAVADIYCENCKTTLGWKYVSPRGPRDHGDSGPEKDGCRLSRWGRRPGGAGRLRPPGRLGAGRGLWT